jgi:hypothetical protein
MKLEVKYSMSTSIGLKPELDDKIRTFFNALGFKSIGSGSGFGWRDLEFKKEEKAEECHGSSLFENGEASLPQAPDVL